MVIDKIEHQQFLLELMKQVNYPGHLLDLAWEVKQQVLQAEVVQEQQKSAGTPVAPEEMYRLKTHQQNGT
jgi:hypothetical protein